MTIYELDYDFAASVTKLEVLDFLTFAADGQGEQRKNKGKKAVVSPVVLPVLLRHRHAL